MEYEELIEKVLKGRTVNATAKAIGVPQPSLDKYVKKTTIPDCDNGYKMVVAAGIDLKEGFETLAKAERLHKLRKQKGFVQTDLLFLCGGGVFVAILSILCKMDDSAEHYIVVLIFSPRSHPARHVDQTHST